MTPNSGAVTREGKPGGSTGRTWTLTLPLHRPLTLNDRHGHWGQRHRAVKQLRADVTTLARAARIPACQRIQVELHYAPPDRRRRDADGLVATHKPAVDGLVDAGCVADDSPEYVDHRMPVLDPPCRPARLYLIVQDLGGAA